MIVKLLTEHHLEFLSLKVGSRGSSESTHVKMSNCWKSHALARMVLCCGFCVGEDNTCPMSKFTNFLVFRDCCVALPNDATAGLSAVFDCGIS